MIVRCALSPTGRGQGEGCENPPVIPFAVLSRAPWLACRARGAKSVVRAPHTLLVLQGVLVKTGDRRLVLA